MTFITTCECDARGCSAVIDLDAYEDHDATLRKRGWHDDPVYEGQHYCKSCWPKVKAEFEEELCAN